MSEQLATAGYKNSALKVKTIAKDNSQAGKDSPGHEVQKLTALWALSESSVGGILHALKIPFRGMFISVIAIVIIGMIAQFAQRPFQIIKSTVSVLMVKALISPHTPAPAYLAVFLQGIFGQLYFSVKGFRLMSALLLGTTVALINGLQRIIGLTLIYGQNLWQTIDDFFVFVNREWVNHLVGEDISLSYWLIVVYVAIHLLIGLAAGLLAFYLPKKVESKMHDIVVIQSFETHQQPRTSKRKRKWMKSPAVVIFVFALMALALSYLYPSTEAFDATGILIMLFRSLIILFLWFVVLGPFLNKYVNSIIHKKRENKYATEVAEILTSLPDLKNTLSAAWVMTSDKKNVRRLLHFGMLALAGVLRKP